MHYYALPVIRVDTTQFLDSQVRHIQFGSVTRG